MKWMPGVTVRAKQPQPFRYRGVSGGNLSTVRMSVVKQSKQFATIGLAVVLSSTALLAEQEESQAGKARAAVLKAYDANQDGKLDKEERAEVLKTHDANKDGKLDKDERKALAQSVLENPEPENPQEEVPVEHDPSIRLPYPPIKHGFKDWVPVERTTGKVVRVEQDVIEHEDDTWELDFYRNEAYKCGLSGNHTFLVFEPRNAAGSKAPLWVYFHGGGNGYFDKDGKYRTLRFQNQDTHNHEETFETLRLVNNGQPVFEKGRLSDADTTLTRRVREGYRLLVIGYGDHDQYSGKGTPYPHNPKGGEVNGLQASMSAVEYTVANYPTTQVFAHGTSAGSAGAYALGFAFARDGIDLTGVVMDSGINTPRKSPIGMAMVKNNSRIVPPDALEIIERENQENWWGSYRGLIDKIGVMIDPEYPFYPEAAVKAGYDSVPMLIVAGEKDPFFGGQAPTIAEAKSAGMGNVAWMWDGLRQAIDEQEDSPHQLLVVKAGHVPTAKKPGHPVHDQVDAFIKRAIKRNPTSPFKAKASKN